LLQPELQAVLNDSEPSATPDRNTAFVKQVKVVEPDQEGISTAESGPCNAEIKALFEDGELEWSDM
jgi:hypothetical protein